VLPLGKGIEDSAPVEAELVLASALELKLVPYRRGERDERYGESLERHTNGHRERDRHSDRDHRDRRR